MKIQNVFGIIVGLTSTVVLAGSVNGLTTFSANTTASATEVNNNFTAVKTAVDDNDGRVTAVESVVSGGNIVLPTSTAVTGNIRKNANRFLHNYGSNNTFLGINAGNFSLSGTNNTGLGRFVLSTLTSGDYNTALGSSALAANTTGSGNTASGFEAMAFNTTGLNNTATGSVALKSNTTGFSNTAIGSNAMYLNDTGYENTAVGIFSLRSNVVGARNTAIGYASLYNSTAYSNTAVGWNSLLTSTSGIWNTAIGDSALIGLTTGQSNIGVGFYAGSNLTSGTNNIDIGNPGVAGESETTRLGTTQTRTFIAGIRGITTDIANGVAVVIDSNGQLGTMSSSRRFKEDIRDIGNDSEVLQQLRPVSFHYKTESPEQRVLQYGLIAEEVAKVAPGLVARSSNGEIETVYYQFLVPMLVSEYQRQQRIINAQIRRLASLEKQTQDLLALKQEVELLHRTIARNVALSPLVAAR